MGQTIDLNVLAVMWVLIAAAALAGGVMGAAWRELSLRGRWKRTEDEFQTQLQRQVSTRDAKILDLEGQLSQGRQREAELRGRVMSLESAPKFAVVQLPEDEEPQELTRHHSDASADVI